MANGVLGCYAAKIRVGGFRKKHLIIVSVPYTRIFVYPDLIEETKHE